MRILFLVNELRYTCGVTNHLLHLAGGLSRGNELYIISGGGNGTERFGNMNIRLITDERFLHAKRNIIYFLPAIKFLAGFIRREKIDIIHSHYHYGANIAAYASRLSHVKTVQTNHGILARQGRLKHFSADLYIAINEHIKEHILTGGIADEKRVEFIRCGIPFPAEIPEKDHGKISFISASRLNREKGNDIFIKAVSALNDESKSKAEFLIAGEGENERFLKKLNDELNAGVRFLGRIEDIYGLLSRTHALVYPSRSSSEGFPAVITEAGAMNNLVISSRFRGYESILQDKSNCFLFDAEDHDKLTEILESVIDKTYVTGVPAMKLCLKIRKLYSVDEMIQKHIAVYEKLLSVKS